MFKGLLFFTFLIISADISHRLEAQTPDLDCGAQESKNILEKIYSCSQGVPDLDELFKKEKIRTALNYVCYLCLHKDVDETLKKEKKQICERMYVEAIEKFSEIDLVMKASRCSKLDDVAQKIKEYRSPTFLNCEFASSKVLKLGHGSFKQFLCVGHVYCQGEKGARPYMQEAHCMVEPKYPGETDNSKNADNLKCPSVEMCAFDLGSIREVDEVGQSWSGGDIHEEYANYVQGFRLSSFPDSAESNSAVKKESKK